MTLSLGAENAAHGFHEALPLGTLLEELGASERCEAVEAGAAGVLGFTPAGGEPAALEKTLEGGIEGAVIDDELVSGLLFEELADSIGVIGAGLETAEDENFERALKEFEALRLIVYGRHTIGRC
jgi:hypothetical protein